MHSEPSQISKMEIFCENSEQLLAVKYFRKSATLDVWLSSEYASGRSLKKWNQRQQLQKIHFD